MTSELEFQRQVDDLAKLRGWKKLALDVVQKKRATGTARGWPDRVYFRRGRIVVLEMKAEKGGVVSAEQRAWLDIWCDVASVANRSDELSVTVAVVKPSDMATISRWLA